MGWSSDGKFFASLSTSDGRIRIWDALIQRKTPRFTLVGHQAAVGSIDWSPDGKRIASTATDGAAKIWDLATGEEVLTLRSDSLRELKSIHWSKDGQRLAAMDSDQALIVWDASRGYSLDRTGQ
jgi:WD40 repeat protein